MSMNTLPFELLCEILGSSCNPATLYHCVLVCKSFKEAALPKLYGSITLKTLRLAESGEGLNFSALETLDKYSHLRPYVREVKFCFVLSDYVRRSRHTNSGLKRAEKNVWVDSLTKLPNVTSSTFYHFAFPDSHTGFLPIPSELIELMASAFRNWNSLGELNLLYRPTRTDITRFGGLKKIRSFRLGIPPKEVIVEARPMIEQCETFGIQPTAEIFVQDAYAIDSLSTIQPYIANLSRFHLGAHHALGNRDLLQLLKCTERLQELDLFYDNFLNTLPLPKDRPLPRLQQLHKLVLHHHGVSSRAQYLELFKWLEIIIAASPITSLSILSDDDKECNFAMPLIALVIQKPIEFLNIPHIILRQPSLRMLFGKENKLQVLSIMLVDVNVLTFHNSVLPGELSFQLSALYLRSNRVTCSYSLVAQQLRSTILSLRGSPGFLRRLTQEKGTWKALWTQGSCTGRQGLDSLRDEYGTDSTAPQGTAQRRAY
ncbi:hypothetical protein GYMLUDRAFT_54967 [Collybiopsis luxurians FD-317 M1]|nr:hypothetical protein GYMLUDRAFT_54967 [Collybiopsis luxurians FD-317 M1]